MNVSFIILMSVLRIICYSKLIKRTLNFHCWILFTLISVKPNVKFRHVLVIMSWL